ncbi:putative aldo/keto reductase [Xylaria grammica]|nr:putative aldo/keto reductase [Xylaria grammica]
MANMNQNIPVRRIGKNGPTVPALGLGLMGMSALYGAPPSDEERFKVLDRAVEIGATFWDSSDMYGDNEELLGKWFKRTGKRNQIFLVTKFGFLKGSSSEIDSSAAFCKNACVESLRALGTDEGKIKCIGLSEVSSSTLRRACKVGQVDAVQAEYSPFEREIEGAAGTNLLDTCRELGVTLVAYSPLGRGMLTGVLNSQQSISGDGDYRSLFPRFSEENLDANVKVVNQLKIMAEKKGCTTAQLALAWVLKQGQHVIAIPGTKKIKYLEENFAALQVILTDAEEVEIREIAAGVAGERTPDWTRYQCYVDTVEED